MAKSLLASQIFGVSSWLKQRHVLRHLDAANGRKADDADVPMEGHRRRSPGVFDLSALWIMVVPQDAPVRNGPSLRHSGFPAGTRPEAAR